MDWYVDTTQVEAFSEVKAEVTAYLRRHALDGEPIADAQVIVSELMANAMRHATGPAWVSVTWAGEQPVVAVRDLGPGFVLDPRLPDDPLALGGGRGLYIVDQLADDLAGEVRASGGSVVTATLPVHRAEAESFDPPRHHATALPALEEARPEGGFGKESFLRALVVQLAQTLEASHGPAAAEAAIAQVGADVGGQMEAEFRAARAIVGRMAPEQLGECYVRLKHAIDGGFSVVEATDDRIVLVNDRCPFGDAVRQAPALCRMTSSVFGGIAARNSEEGAAVVLEERIALGDPGCRVVVHLDHPSDDPSAAHHYRAGAAAV